MTTPDTRPDRPADDERFVPTTHPPLAPERADALRPGRADTAAPDAGRDRQAPSSAGVFLSPRVIDQSAFEDFAGRLRAMLDECANASASLGEVLESTNAARDSVAEAGKKQRSTLDVTAKLLRTLTDKHDEMSAVLSRIDASTSAAAEVERRAAEAFRTESERLDDRIAQAVARALASLDDAVNEREARVTALIEKLDAQRASVDAELARSAGDLNRTLERNYSRACRLLGWDPEDVAAGEGAGRPARDSLADVVERAAGVRAEADTASKALVVARDDANAAAAALSGSLSDASAVLERLERRRADLAGQVDDAVRRADKASATIADHGEALRRAIEPIEHAESQADRTVRGLQAVVSQAEGILVDAGERAGSLAENVARAEAAERELRPWARLIEGGALAGDRLPAPLASVVERFRGELTQDLAKMAAAMNMIANRAETAVRPPAGPGDSPEIVIRMARAGDAESSASAPVKAAG